jgi:GT2 family glycosyltransferase
MVRSEFPEIRVISNDENVGFARANNQSWREARGRYWLLLNSDTEVRPGAIDALVAFMDSHARAGLATARLVNGDGTPQNCAQRLPSIFRTLFEASRLHKLLPRAVRGRMLLGPYWSYDDPAPIGWTWGTALVARREAVEEAGPLSEHFFMYGEDLDWCLRMQRNRWEIWFCPEAEVLHFGGQSSARRWEEDARLRIKLDGIYKAIERHRGRAYLRLLQSAALVALGIEWLALRVRARDSRDVSDCLAYHQQALTGKPVTPADIVLKSPKSREVL